MLRLDRLFLLFLLSSVLFSCRSDMESKTDIVLKQDVYVPKYAKYFKITYQDSSKTIHIFNPWGKKTMNFSYTIPLVPENKAVSAHKTDIYLPSVPHKVVCMSSPSAGLMVNLGLDVCISGVTDTKYIYNSALNERIAKGDIVDLGSNLSFNMEQMLMLEPDLIINSGWDNLNESMAKLQKLKIPVFFTYEWKENHPLGKAEWMVALAAFFGNEQKAIQSFDSIAESYISIQAEAEQQQNKPLVFTGSEFQGIWHSSGGNSYMARLVKDAGGEYLFQSDSSSGSKAIDFEVLVNTAKDADIWIYSGGVDALSLQLLKQQKYKSLKTIKTGNIYSYHARQLPSGANDYWETSIYNPHLVLKDLRQIFSAQKRKDCDLYYFAKLQFK